MPQIPAENNFNELRAGLFTEGSPLNSPKGSTKDERNFHINVDGSRRRRRGLRVESGQTAFDATGIDGSDRVTTAHWHNAGGDPDADFIVVQVGSTLVFFQNTGATLSSQEVGDRIELGSFSTTGNATDVAYNPLHFAFGRGTLLVTGRYLTPLIVEYDSTADPVFSTTTIQPRIRDFRVAEDGTDVDFEPTSSLTESHEYNLRNAGWRAADISQYFTDKAKYPARNMIWYMGYARQIDGVTYVNEDGVKAWNSNKIEAEPFGNSPAPRGALFLDPFDTSFGRGVAGNTSYSITTWSVASTALEEWTVTVTTDSAHGLSPSDTITIDGNRYRAKYLDAESGTFKYEATDSLNGTYTVVSTPSATTFTITYQDSIVYNTSDTFFSWVDQFQILGTVEVGEPLTNPNGYTTNERPQAVAFYAGRAWFSGVQHPEMQDHIYFSRLIVEGNEYSDWYQVNDPTMEEQFNQLLPSDGGDIVIPDMGQVVEMLPYEQHLLVFTTNGIWQITCLDATDIQARKLTDVPAESPWGQVKAEGRVFFASPSGIYQIAPDPNTGYLVTTSLTFESIQTRWNQVAARAQEEALTLYDPVNKQLRVLHHDAGAVHTNHYDAELIYDLRLNAWADFRFPDSDTQFICSQILMHDPQESGTYKHIKYVVVDIDADVIEIADMDHDDYVDFDGAEQSAYLHFNEDNVEEFARYRQAPIVHTFMGRTETGLTTDADGNAIPINDSSLTMEAYWDFSDDSVSGKVSRAQEVYRHRRVWTPAAVPSATFNNGYPVVVARTKVPGRGRALSLKFTAGTAKDAHLLGYAIAYRASRGV